VALRSDDALQLAVVHAIKLGVHHLAAVWTVYAPLEVLPVGGGSVAAGVSRLARRSWMRPTKRSIPISMPRQEPQ
jgi:hypothetical protein